MTISSHFLPFITRVLRAFEVGDYSAIDAENIPFDGKEEQEIISALLGIQRRNLQMQEVLQRCAVGDYSVPIKGAIETDIASNLINAVLEKLRGVVRQANTISLGDYSAELPPQSEKDELGIALYEMTKSLREIAEVSAAISSGDFTKQVEAKGERDYLARAINEMIGSLREMEKQASAIASGNYTLQIGARSERDELARAIDKMMKIIRSQMVALQQSNQSLSEFAHVASHDLNAPLCKIRYSSELIREACQGKVHGNASQLFDVITRSCEQMAALIRDLLDHASITGGEAAVDKIDLNDIVERVRSDLSQSLYEVGAQINVTPLPIVLGQRTSFVRLFQNLISNALKYRGSRPLVLEICATVETHDWIISFKDNGIGINSSDYQKIFDPFVRLHTAVSIPGTGIGLATCKKITEQLGGKIWVESKLGIGSTFFVSIPKSASDMASTLVSLPARKKILMIDDDKDQLLIFSALLEKENFEVVISDSSAHGLQILTNEAFDLVISDVQMPQMNGAQFIQALRGRSSIPIIMLTSSGAEGENELKAIGASDFCIKNDAFRLLIPKVLGLLRA